jgi:CRP-like cAMP-binding protein
MCDLPIAQMRAHFHAGEVIFRQGETANRFYLIENGKVVLESAERSAARRS